MFYVYNDFFISQLLHYIADRVFCPLHRLPELHGCQFDHKEDGRREAREKMVKPTRHLGTSFRRLDSDS